MNRITGRSAFLALLRDEGITHLFGNPGTTEAMRITDPAELKTQLASAFKRPGTKLIEVVVDGVFEA